VHVSRGQVYFVLAVLFALLVAVFAIQNPESVSIRLLFWQFDNVPKILLILVSTAVGALVVVLLGVFWNIGKVLHIRRLEAEIRVAKNKLNELSSVQVKTIDLTAEATDKGTTL
jgi:putative membrane protein